MKVVVFFISFIFFSTQIIPLKYVSYLCDYELCEHSDEDDCNDSLQLKDKLKTDKEVYLRIPFFSKSSSSNISVERKNYSILNISIPDDYINSILVPPPNC